MLWYRYWKIPAECARPGDTLSVRFWIHASGAGEYGEEPADSVTIVCQLPDEAEFLDAEDAHADEVSYNPGPPQTVTMFYDSLLASGDVGEELGVKVRVKEDVDVDSIVHYAEVSCVECFDSDRDSVWTPICRQCRTWYILPDSTGDAPSIQAGIDSTSACDTVLVACGTYYEHDIVMKSGVTLVSETGEPDCVTIDAQGLGRIFYCSGIDSTTTIDGFTLTGGLMNSDAGAMAIAHSSFTVRNCVISDNSVTGGHAGGALRCRNSTITFSDCVFSGNTADAHGGGVYCRDSCSPLFEGCVFTENRTPGRGGGFYCWNGCTPTLTNCTFFDNTGSLGGGISSTNSSIVTVENTILSFSSSGEAVYCDGTSAANLLCCDVYGNQGGDWEGCISFQEGQNGNFGEDPLFCDTLNGDFHLEESSPCAPAQQPSCGLIGALGPGCYAGVPEWEDTHGKPSALLSVGPNPSQVGTRIIYQVAGEQGAPHRVLLRVFDASGRHVRTLVDRPKSVGRHTVDWDGLDSGGNPVPPGVYFCRFESDNHVLTQKIVRLK
jgi:predicted outer membrane repeat protein